MNKRIKRILSAVLVCMILFSDCSGILSNISHATESATSELVGEQKEIELEPKLILDMSLNSYLNLPNLEKRVLKVKVKADYENVTEIGEAVAEIAIPKLMGENPIKIKINEISGASKLARTLSEEEYTVNTEEGKITINKAINEIDVYLEYQMMHELTEESSVYLSCNLKCGIPNNILEEKSEKEELILEKEVDIVSTNTIQSKEIYKGFFEDNISNEREFSYETTEELKINYANDVENLMYTSNEVKVLNYNEEVILSTIDKVITKISIKKESIQNIIGENGKVEIFDENLSILGEISKDTQTNENGIIEINLENPVRGYSFKFSEVATEGKINVKVSRKITFSGEYNKEEAILADTMSYSTQVSSNKKEMVKNELFGQTIESENTEETEPVITEMEVEKEVINKLNEVRIKINEANPTIDVTMSNKNIQTMKENEVIFTASLRNDKYEYKLLENPSIEIELPQEVEEASLEAVTIMHKGNFEVGAANIYRNENGNFVIRVDVVGKEENYKIDAIQEGANVLISAKLKTNIHTSSRKTEVKYRTYENGNQIGESKEEAQIVSKYGIANIVTISLENQSIISTDSEVKQIKIGPNDTEKIVKIESSILNNYEETVSGLEVIGNMSNEEINLKDGYERIGNVLNGPVVVSGKNVKIEYSMNGNTWTEQYSDNMKAFKLVCNEEFLAGETINLEYYIKIPGNLKYYMATCSSIEVKENYDGEQESKMTYLEITTGDGPKVEMNMETSVSSDFVFEDQVVTYTVNVENTGETTIENAIIDIELPEQFIYTEIITEELEGQVRSEYREYAELKNKQWSISNFAPNSTKTVEFNVKVGEIVNDEAVFVKGKVLANNASGVQEVVAEDMEGKFVQEPAIEVVIEPLKSVNQIIEEDEFLCYYITVKNLSDSTLTNVKGHIDLSEYVTFEDSYEITYVDDGDENSIGGVTYNKETHSIDWNFTELLANSSRKIFLDTKTITFNENVTGATVKFSVKITGDNIPNYESNIISHKLEGIKIRVTQQLITPKKVLEKESIIFEIKVENNNVFENLININSILNQEIILKEFEIYENGELKDTVYWGTNEIEYSYMIEAESSIVIRLKCKAGMLERDTYKDVFSKGNISVGNRKFKYEDATCRIEKNYELIGYLKGSALTGNIIKTQPELKENSQGLENVEVTLYNADTGKVILDETGAPKVTTTNENGQYEFTEVENGNYIVGYEYNPEEYTVVEYSKQENEEELITSKQIEETKKIAITDVVTIEDKSQYDVNINIEEVEKFDLAVTQSINQITVEGKEVSNVYKKENLENIKLSNKEMKNSTATVEYTIEVKNEGNIVAYVDRIEQKLEQDYEFKLALNEGWKKDTEGNLYYSKLENVAIQPGETKEISLVLTKTELNKEFVSNNIEISKANSIKGNIETEHNLSNNTSSISLIIEEQNNILFVIAIILIIAIASVITILILSKKEIKIRKVYK